MGVFDDAIREHLELKRQKGADEEELKELEDEAFGQAARPGDPDFPGSTSEEEAVEGGTLQRESEVAEGEPSAPTEPSKPFDAAAETPPAEQPSPAPAAETSEQDVAPPSAEPASEEVPAVEEPASEEAPAVDEPELAEPEPVDEPAVPNEPEPPSSFSTAEREAIADQPTVFFDQAPAELELGDLELDFDEEIEEVGGAVSEPVPGEDESLGVEETPTEEQAEEPAAEVAEPPHEVEPEPAPPEEPAPLEPAPSEPEPESAALDALERGPSEPETSDFAPPGEESEPGTGEDDVLEETPEFLRDNPDDDELWFEQGEPKDFDF